MTIVQQQRRRYYQEGTAVIPSRLLVYANILFLILLLGQLYYQSKDNGGAGSNNSSLSSLSSSIVPVVIDNNGNNNHDDNDHDSTTTIQFPIFILGLPRSGSLALHNYFTCRGMTSSHYCCDTTTTTSTSTTKTLPTEFPCFLSSSTTSSATENTNIPPPFQQNKLSTCGECILRNLQNYQQSPTQQEPQSSIIPSSFVEECGSYQVWSSFHVEMTDPYYGYFLPQHYSLGLLHVAYPNATWILNYRENSFHWAKSMYSWQTLTQRMLQSFGVPTSLLQQQYDKEKEFQSSPPPNTKVSKLQVMNHLQMKFKQYIHNETWLHLEKEYQMKALQTIYETHTRKVLSWRKKKKKTTTTTDSYSSSSSSSLHHPYHRLITVNVDGPSKDIISQLDQIFFNNNKKNNDESSSHSHHHCEWTFNATLLEQDWKDFSIPFS